MVTKVHLTCFLSVRVPWLLTAWLLHKASYSESLLACHPQEGRSQPDSLPLGVVLTRVGRRAQTSGGSERILGVAGEGIGVRGPA